MVKYLLVGCAFTALFAAACGHAQASPQDPDARAKRVEADMTDDERIALLSSVMTIPFPGISVDIPKEAITSAGYVPGLARLKIPALSETDASLGVTNPMQIRPGDTATALPSGLALAATFDMAMAERAGAMVGAEARAKGFNILLGGGANLARDPRSGRNFEYLGEDPLLAGRLAGAAIRGTQAQGVVSTIKHFVLNGQETQRHTGNAVIDPDRLRESDLLAFQIGIEIGKPGSVMCAYNLVNGAEACGNDPLLNGVLKGDWGYKGWVMSDWGAVESTDFILKGLDQQSGYQLDEQHWFGAPLKQAVADGAVPRSRVSDAVRRILRSVYAAGADVPAPSRTIDFDAHAKVALQAARDGIVLLKNDGVLPLAQNARSILVVGGQAGFGVLSGGGSSQVTPHGEAPRIIDPGNEGWLGAFQRQVYFPSSPVTALREMLPDAQIAFVTGYMAENAAAAAKSADMVIIFATKWEGEELDSGSIALPQGQDEMIARIAAANPNTVVVLETGNPVSMPWLDKVRAVVEAWYPGQEGGRAIADILTGRVNPSGRLPMTFPRTLETDPRPAIPGLDLPARSNVDIPYSEGSEVGYRRRRTLEGALFPFGYGLSYTHFSHSPLAVSGDKDVTLHFTVRNEGDRAGSDVPQVYLVARKGKPLQRLVGFEKVQLAPGQSTTISMKVDNRLLADFVDGGWDIPSGRYGFAVGHSAATLGPVSEIVIRGHKLRP